MKKRIFITISGVDLAYVDAMAKRLEISRTEVISRMIAFWQEAKQ
jgi:hypothetical protein